MENKEQKSEDVSKSAQYILNRHLNGVHIDNSNDAIISAMQEFAQSESLKARNEALEDGIKAVIRLAGIRYHGFSGAQTILGEVMDELSKLKG